MGVVIKRGGKRQAFSPSKIKNSILGAAKEAKLNSAKAKELVKEVGDSVINFYKDKRTVKVSAIRKSILGRLNRRAKSVSRAWRAYEARRKNSN